MNCGMCLEGSMNGGDMQIAAYKMVLTIEQQYSIRVYVKIVSSIDYYL